jgi:hypothetical protein
MSLSVPSLPIVEGDCYKYKNSVLSGDRLRSRVELFSSDDSTDDTDPKLFRARRPEEESSKRF